MTDITIKTYHPNELPLINAAQAFNPSVLIRIEHERLDALHALWPLFNRGFHIEVPFYITMSHGLLQKSMEQVDVSRIINNQLIESSSMRRCREFKHITKHRKRWKWHLCLLDGLRIDSKWSNVFPLLQSTVIQHKLKLFESL